MASVPFWMSQAVTMLSALALVSAFAVLALRTLHLVIRAYAAQSLALGLAALLVGLGSGRPHVIGVAAFTILLKTFVIPRFLFKVISDVRIKREADPFVSYPVSMLCGVAFALLSYAAAWPLSAGDAFAGRGFALALTLMLLGLWLMVGRRKAITQVVGLLVMENGLFVAALSTAFAMPMVVELGLAFDLLVAVAVMGLLIFRIQSTFGSMNTERLMRLRG